MKRDLATLVCLSLVTHGHLRQPDSQDGEPGPIDLHSDFRRPGIDPSAQPTGGQAVPGTEGKSGDP